LLFSLHRFSSTVALISVQVGGVNCTMVGSADALVVCNTQASFAGNQDVLVRYNGRGYAVGVPPAAEQVELGLWPHPAFADRTKAVFFAQVGVCVAPP
jgi:hypothetical protein